MNISDLNLESSFQPIIATKGFAIALAIVLVAILIIALADRKAPSDSRGDTVVRRTLTTIGVLLGLTGIVVGALIVVNDNQQDDERIRESREQVNAFLTETYGVDNPDFQGTASDIEQGVNILDDGHVYTLTSLSNGDLVLVDKNNNEVPRV